MDQPVGVQPRACWNVRQCAANDYWRPWAAAGQRRHLVHQERQARWHEDGPVQAGDHQSAESSERAHASDGEHIWQLELRPNEYTGGLMRQLQFMFKFNF